MQLLLDREDAERNFYEYLIESQKEFCDNESIKNGIEEVLNNQEKFCKMVDIALFRDICNVIDHSFKNGEVIFNSKSTFIFSNYFNYCSGIFYPPIKLKCSNTGIELLFGFYKLSFLNFEELREYLYCIAGFEYQSCYDSHSNSIDDPFVSSNFVKPLSPLELCQDLSLLEKINIPKTVVTQKIKI